MWKYPKAKEKRRRSMVRSVVWRALGVLVLAVITYAFTRNWITTTMITAVHHTTFVLVYYLHERFWLKTKWLRDSRWKPYMRVVTYEVVLGNLILAAISYGFTGDLQKMTAITLTYITNKYWMFYVYDILWGKIKWQREIQ